MMDSAGAAPDAQRLERLLAFLGVADGDGYRRVHARVSSFFRWKGLGDGAALADETLDRAARRLTEGGVHTQAPMAFLLGIARFVAMEAQRKEAQQRTVERASAASAEDPGDERAEAEVTALEGCLTTLFPAERALVLEYYREGSGRSRIESRQRQAQALGIGLNALRIRAFRLRERLEQCIAGKLSETHSPAEPQEGR